jgi:hypothetical protein
VHERTNSPRTVFAVANLAFVPAIAAQEHPSMPAGMTHEQHMAQMKKEAEMKQHGQMAMGFDQDRPRITSRSCRMAGRSRSAPTTRPTRRPATRFDRI